MKYHTSTTQHNCGLALRGRNGISTVGGSGNAWSTITNEPIVSGGNYNVTNTSVLPTNRFYRLHKP
jgi:hypothetical protein